MEQTQNRDFQTEVTEFFTQRPDLKDSLLPDEVARECAAGKSLQDAYADYETRRKTPAVSSPVRGMTAGGSPSAQQEDPFLKGFRTEW